MDQRQALDVLGLGAYGWTLRQKRLVLQESCGDDATSMAVTRAALDSAHRALDAGHTGQDDTALPSYVADRDRA